MNRHMNALFDEGRRKAIREALRSGKSIFGRPQAEPPMHSGISELGRLDATILLSSPPQFRVGKQTYSPNSLLMLAIQHNDVEHVRIAVENGADINHKVAFLPVSPSCDSEHPARYNDPSVETPLQYAIKLGHREIEEFLRAHGARE